MDREERFLAWAGFVGLIILILLTIFTPDFLMQHEVYLFWIVIAFSILLVSFVVSIVFVRAMRKPKVNQFGQTQKGIQFYTSRKASPSLEDFLSEARQGGEIWIIGVSLENIVGQSASAFKKQIERGVTVKFYFLNPKSDVIKKWDKVMITATQKAIEGSLERLCEIKENLPEFQKEKIKIILYDLVPFNSFIILDPETDDAKMKVELYQWGKTDPELRPSIIISKKEQKDVFETYLKSFHFALGKEYSNEYECPRKENAHELLFVR